MLITKLKTGAVVVMFAGVIGLSMSGAITAMHAGEPTIPKVAPSNEAAKTANDEKKPIAPGIRLVIPQLGPIPLALDFGFPIIPPPKQLRFDVLIFQGDPLGSKEAGTLEVLMRPQLVTLETQRGLVQAGQQYPVKIDDKVSDYTPGVTVEITPGTVKDGKVRIDVTMTKSTVAENSKEKVQFNTESTRIITTVKLGEVVKLRCGKETWIELSASLTKP